MSMHKYRSADGSTRRVETETGHVALVEGDWRELPAVYHNAAIAAGCECDSKTIAKNTVKPAASSEAVKDKDFEQQIETALKTMLERENEGDFTADGEPNLNVVASLVGVKVKRRDVTPVFIRLQDEAEAAAVAGAGDGVD